MQMPNATLSEPPVNGSRVTVPRSMPTSRWWAPKQAVLPASAGEVPLFDKDTPPEKRIQEVWIAHVKMFVLSDPEDLKQYELVWQGVCDGTAKVSENMTNYDSEKGSYIAFLRWATFDYRIPQQ